jgi:hypothetical protein
MSNQETPKAPMSEQVKIALIGAAATVFVALITGFFALMSRESPPTPAPTAVPTPTATAVSPPTATATLPAPTAVASQQPVSGTGFLFATQITPDGIAIAPAATFPPTVKQIYAVFQPGRTPPGLQVSHPAPQADQYYAYLAPAGQQRPASIGWRWFFQGELVNEYETSTDVGYLWLSVHSQSATGLFEGILGSDGVYEVVITIAGNPVLQTQLAAEP